MRSKAFEREREHNAILRKIDSTWLSPKLLGKPTYVALSISNACDLECVFCARQMRVPPDSGFMDLERFRESVAKVRGAKRATLFGLGDPFLNKRFFEYVEACHEQGIETTTTNHGMHVSEDAARKILDSGMEEVAFSIDAVGQELADELRAKSDMKRIRKNISRLSRMRAERGTEFPHIMIACTISARNMAEMPALVQFAHDVRADTILCSDMVALKPEFAAHTQINPDVFQGLLDKTSNLAGELGVRFERFQQKQRQWEYTALPIEGWSYGCTMLWDGLYIERRGESQPCCYLGPDGSNFFEHSYEEIVQHPGKTRLRGDLMSGRVETVCRGCVNLFPNSPEHVDNVLAEVDSMLGEARLLSKDEKNELREIISQYQSLAENLFPKPVEQPQKNILHRLAKSVTPSPLRKIIRSAIERVKAANSAPHWT